MTKKLLFEIEVDDLQPEPEVDAVDIFIALSKSHPLSVISVTAVEPAHRAAPAEGGRGEG